MALVCGPGPAIAQDGLRTRSPQAVLDDPRVKSCRALAARRASTDPASNSVDTAVETAAALFNIEIVFDAVAHCRAALAAFPAEPSVIIPHFTAAEALSLLAFGLTFPDSDEDRIRLAIDGTLKPGAADGLMRRMLGFYLGSACEYGIGTRPDPAAAQKWYAVAAGAGSKIAERELARLKASGR